MFDEPFAWLCHASTRLHPDDVAPAVQAAGAALGLEDIVVYLVDVSQRWLTPVAVPGQGAGGGLMPAAVASTVAVGPTGQQPVVVPSEDADVAARIGTAMWFPLMDSAERLGVVFAQAAEGSAVEDAALARWSAFVALAAEIVSKKTAYGDMLTI